MVGSQAIISATFSIISQCRALKCFPRVKVVHTSNHIHGQIYIPEVNWILMVLCLAVVVGYRDTDMIGNAYGLAVITVMLVTTCLMFLVIVMVWKRNIFRALAFVIVFGSVELLYFSACLGKVHKGGWLPLIFSLILLSTMCIWHYGTMKKQAYESNNKVSLDMLLSMGPNLGINRVPGLGLIYSNVTTGAPPMFSHFVTNFPAFHRILIFVTVQSLTVPKVPANQRFVISRIGPPEYRLFQCVVRYGYKDQRKDSHDFEDLLIETISEFLQRGNNDSEAWWEPVNQQESIPHEGVTASTLESGVNTGSSKKMVRFRGVGCNKELEDLKEARESGLAYMMGSTCVLACDTSSYLKKFAINFVYRFLRQNSRHPATALGIPHTSLIEVGMVYRV
ncbi:putative potassium transporter 13 [Hibiscus syriacus]|uniref:Potassium transporter 13 n=2 Tax=Hibiscus syriacus TaxID=106335 RepID=A0A6A3ATH1_HIBSY|nr:putative potassium transporter 13 [Hibiscus syriacus]